MLVASSILPETWLKKNSREPGPAGRKKNLSHSIVGGRSPAPLNQYFLSDLFTTVLYISGGDQQISSINSILFVGHRLYQTLPIFAIGSSHLSLLPCHIIALSHHQTPSNKVQKKTTPHPKKTKSPKNSNHPTKNPPKPHIPKKNPSKKLPQPQTNHPTFPYPTPTCMLQKGVFSYLRNGYISATVDGSEILHHLTCMKPCK